VKPPSGGFVISPGGKWLDFAQSSFTLRAAILRAYP
jgi:hypothetical protein